MGRCADILAACSWQKGIGGIARALPRQADCASASPSFFPDSRPVNVIFCKFAGKYVKMEPEENYLYSQNVLDFVRVCTEYCRFLEQASETERNEFVDVMRGLLPMLYLKGSLLQAVPEVPGYNEQRVTEEDYNYIRARVCAVMGEFDEYLDVFVEDFKFSDKPVLCTISEDLADVYQVLRELVECFREGYEEAMQVAIYEVREQFPTYWGRTVLNALRALHDVRFGD